MPGLTEEPALLEPEEGTGEEIVQSNLGDSAKALAEQVRRTIPFACAFASRTLALRMKLADLVAQERTEEAHKQRDALIAQVRQRLRWLQVLISSFPLTEMLGEAPIARSEEVRRLASEIESLANQLGQEWQTPADLERLAIKWCSLSTSRLTRLAESHPPAPSWFDEEQTPS